MKKLRWVLLIVLALIIIFLVVYIYNGRYVWNYFSAVGVRSGITIEQLERRLGEPNNIIFPDNGGLVIVQHNGIDFMFFVHRDSGNITYSSLDVIIIVGSEVRLGSQQIGVGSTREEILYTYESRRSVRMGDVFDSAGRHIRIQDGNTWVNFHFDENYIVKSIHISLGGPV